MPSRGLALLAPCKSTIKNTGMSVNAHPRCARTGPVKRRQSTNIGVERPAVIHPVLPSIAQRPQHALCCCKEEWRLRPLKTLSFQSSAAHAWSSGQHQSVTGCPGRGRSLKPAALQLALPDWKSAHGSPETCCCRTGNNMVTANP